jgi:hypothetical protein
MRKTFYKASLAIVSILCAGVWLSSFSNFESSSTSQLRTEPDSSKTPIDQQYNQHVIDDFVHISYTDIYLNVSPRFAPLRKSELKGAKSITDFLDPREWQGVEDYKEVRIIIIEDDKETERSASGPNTNLTPAQLKLLRTADYSTNFMVRAEYYEGKASDAKRAIDYYSPYHTIVPEKQAVYTLGERALLHFLGENNKENTINVKEADLKPAKIYFTVTENGSISKVRLDRTTGFPKIDEKMLYLIKHLPGSWEPAENERGEKVAQELTLTVGARGC